MNFSSQTNTEHFKKEFEEFLKEKYGTPDPEQDSQGSKSGPKSHAGSDIDFDQNPEELEAYLNHFVECQPEAVEVIATKIATHYKRMKLEDTFSEEQKLVGNIKSNVLLIGPTGVGKTYIVKLIAKKIGVPFVKGDATKFSETGYVGGDVEDLIRELVKEADGDIKRAEYGIVYLDEVDKIASAQNMRGVDVSRSGVQRNLLKLMEESEVDLRVPHDMASQMEAAMEAQRTGKVDRKKINTKNILFVMSGAFSGLDDIIRKRVNQKRMGFGSDPAGDQALAKSDLFRQVTTQDLMEYGFESEFIGRLPVVAVLNELTVDALFNILKNDDSSVTLSKKRDFQAYGIEIQFEDAALRIIAERAHQQKTGARGLVNIIENILVKYEKRLPSTKIRKFTVTEAIVTNPEQELNKLLTRQSMKEFQQSFLETTGIVLEFEDAAINRIAQLADQHKKTFLQTAKDLFKDYEYGLKLAGRNHFSVTDSIVMDPKACLDEIIRTSYQSKQQV